MPHRITISKDGKKQVELNYYDAYYNLQYDWPMDTIWNLNGSLEDAVNRMYRPEGVYIEIFTKEPNAQTYTGTYGKDFKECETKLWKRYQTYLHCQHEFTRESPTGIHYDNGAGFCKHCGMFQSEIFEPETICESCGQHAIIFPLLNGKCVCEECYEQASWENKPGLSYYTPNMMMKFFNNREKPLLSWIEKEKENEKSLRFEFAEEDSFVEINYCKILSGLWKATNINIQHYYILAKLEFGPKYVGNYLIENQKALDVVNVKYKELKNAYNKADMRIKLQIEDEMTQIEELNEQKELNTFNFGVFHFESERND